METSIISPSTYWYVFLLIPVIGVSLFIYIMAKRLAPLMLAAPDPRSNRLRARTFNMLKYALGQYRQPRYMFAGILHIIIFAGFMIISFHSVALVMSGIKEGFSLPFTKGILGRGYSIVKDTIATAVFVAAAIALIRRVVFKPKRYAVPPKYGKEHTFEAVFILLMIMGLMVSDSIYEGSLYAAKSQAGLPIGVITPYTLTWMAGLFFVRTPIPALQSAYMTSYVAHELIFFSFLNILPMGKHFHVITSFFNVFFMKLDKGTVKPVQWGVDETRIDTLTSVGVKKFEDFTWKHMLDFYSCTDCGRCSDHCPATAAGRPLSPRFISIKCRDYSFRHYSLFGKFKPGEPLLGGTLEEDEIWSCTTCGACEEECPLLIEYIDKIVDVRRGMMDDGRVPQSLQKPLNSLAKRANPYGKMEKKRGDWATALEKDEGINVKILGLEKAKTLYFVDSVTSYDDRIQKIGKSMARVMTRIGVDFGILGSEERDSGHEIKRFGEELLFLEMKSYNTVAILDSGVENIVTNDPHAMNALKNDYKSLPKIEHISQLLERSLTQGLISLKEVDNKNDVYVFHDPCYLGRHNGLYTPPRNVIDAIPGVYRVEMKQCKDKSFCCGGGGLMLYYEPPEEEKRIGQIRVEMAKKAGATVIVTACPFCMINIEDAIKTCGFESSLRVIDLVELIDQQMIA